MQIEIRKSKYNIYYSSAKKMTEKKKIHKNNANLFCLVCTCECFCFCGVCFLFRRLVAFFTRISVNCFHFLFRFVYFLFFFHWNFKFNRWQKYGEKKNIHRCEQLNPAYYHLDECIQKFQFSILIFPNGKFAFRDLTGWLKYKRRMNSFHSSFFVNFIQKKILYIL